MMVFTLSFCWGFLKVSLYHCTSITSHQQTKIKRYAAVNSLIEVAIAFTPSSAVRQMLANYSGVEF